MKYEDLDKLEMNKEYDKLVKVESQKEEKKQLQNLSAQDLQKPQKNTAQKQSVPQEKTETIKKNTKAKAVKKKKKKSKITKQVVKTMSQRQPELEDNEGFNGRRPLVDPFTVGEKVTLALSYFAAPAGTLTLQVKPYVDVNKRKSYHFMIRAKSSRLFSMFYAVDDYAETYIDFETLKPSTYEIHVKESKQLREIKSYFDWKTLKAKYWDTKITKKKGEQNKKKDWAIEDFSQNVISAAFYLRTFTLTPGKKLAFRVADAGKNLVFTAEVLRRETLDTEIGELKTVVLKPNVTIDGVFAPMGDILLWLTDDQNKFIVRIESKIKIGTVVGTLEKIETPKK